MPQILSYYCEREERTFDGSEYHYWRNFDDGLTPEQRREATIKSFAEWVIQVAEEHHLDLAVTAD